MTTQTPQNEGWASPRALARYDAVRFVEEAVKSGLPLRRALVTASERLWNGRRYGAPTLERWYYHYRQKGFAALEIKPRLDKGAFKSLSPQAREVLITLRRDKPQVHVTSLLRELERREVVTPGSVSVNTLYRVLAREGLDARSLSAAVSGPTKAYELSWANQLWTTDGMWGPSVPLVCGGKPVRTHLLGIIDDCSRLCVHAQYYPGERLVHFLDTLKQALQSRGIPDKLYTDNGAVFVSPHLNTVCANFGIRLLHAKPYHSWSKGKIERFWATVQGDFEQRLVFTPATSLEDLNRRFWQWLESDYHQRAHGGLDGQSPAQRFRERSAHLRLVDPAQDIVSLFLSRCRRRVRRDATFSIDGHLFEAPAALRGRHIDVHYDPFGWSRLDLYWNGQLMGQAHPCDKQANARRSRKEDYENF